MERPIRILYIDLAEQKTELKVQPDLGTWVGGNGLGRALLKDDLDSGRVIFSVGPLAEVFPAASWTAAVFISPLTRNLGESFSGGELGRRLAAFGYDAVVLDGKAVSPVFLHLSSGGAEFVPADDVWGQKLPGLWELVERRYSEDTTAYAIGPGGEQGVRFAGVYNSKGQGFQRMGLGCVFGGKNLKGLLLETPPKTNFASSSLGELRDELEGQLFDPTEEGLRFKVERRQRSLWDLGLSLESIPVNNFQSTLTFAGGSISTLFQETSSVSCGNCPVSCRNLINDTVPLSYQGTVCLGPLLGIEDPDSVKELLSEAFVWGLDPVSLGCVLAWFTEKQGWEFGDVDSYLRMIPALVLREEEWARQLSLGLASAATGNSEHYALLLSNLETYPFFNGYLSLASQILFPGQPILISKAALFDLSDEAKSMSLRDHADWLAREIRQTLFLRSLGVCPLAQKVYTPAKIFSCLETLDLAYPHDVLESLPENVYNLGWELRKKEGFSTEELTFPNRFFETETPQGVLEKSELQEIINLYSTYFLDQ